MMKLSFERGHTDKGSLWGLILWRGASSFDPLNHLRAVNLRVFCGRWTLDWRLFRTPKLTGISAVGLGPDPS
jgi:hypothetical protein